MMTGFSVNESSGTTCTGSVFTAGASVATGSTAFGAATDSTGAFVPIAVFPPQKL